MKLDSRDNLNISPSSRQLMAMHKIRLGCCLAVSPTSIIVASGEEFTA